MARFKIQLFYILFFFITISCSRIKISSGTAKIFLKSDSLKNIVWRDIYINDGINLYKLNSAKISPDSIKGEIKLIPDFHAMKKELLRKDAKSKNNRRLMLYTKSPLHIYASQDSASPAYSDNKISLRRDEILNAKTLDADYIALIVVGGILLLLVVAIFGLLYLASTVGSNNSGSGSGSNGCYIATMVYGDYDAPEVMVLRRFRDEVLAKYVAGIIFIKIYYRYSPLFVERFKNSRRINQYIKIILDRVVRSLS